MPDAASAARARYRPVMGAGLVLVMRTGARRCALPLPHVKETMRPLPIEPLAHAPAFVLGAAVIRGAPGPGVDLAAPLGIARGAPRRFVTIAVESRTVALAVDDVVGIRALDDVALDAPPPLLADTSAAVESVGTLDGALLAVLRTAHLLPPSPEVA
jgi:purine-binding chemotaxis protein CheW